ncbi:BON domain-containing protein [Marinagarivorans algicola]|uniref:BON domain-containing protein n=1 Tax=Marinagarivorans algicola TaxID=1513270 RepID=UPI0006B5C97B|nr:BON domain-containing protein [Marinagarivorans algicola]
MNFDKNIVKLAAVSGAFTFACLLSQAAISGEKNHTDDDIKNRMTAKEYWSDFKQDANENWSDTQEAFRDGWLESKLETVLVMSPHVNPFDIDIEVDGSTAILEGVVATEVQKDHAELLSLNVDGIDEVSNKIKIDDKIEYKKEEPKKRSFSQVMADASITASVKTKLLTNDEVSGLDINVDTHQGTVMLSGEVDNSIEKMLAEYIARDDNNVNKVINEIHVKS